MPNSRFTGYANALLFDNSKCYAANMGIAVDSKPYQGKFDSQNKNPYKISRTKIDLFLECPHCFYLDRVLGVSRPAGPPFQLNKMVDETLKREFDVHRVNGEKHPLQIEFGIDAEPVVHEDLNIWRENFHGVQALHEPTNLLVYGAIDDLWINSKGEYVVVDYKATAKNEPITEMGNERWHDSYRRQIEVYQWLLRQNSLTVSNTGYWVYCTGRMNAPSFDKKIEFDVHLISYEGDDSWVEPTILKIRSCLTGELPAKIEACEYCLYTTACSNLG